MNGRCLNPQVDKVARFFGKRKTYHVARVQRISSEDEPSESWVTVHNLKSYNDGGILDPDDKLKDVVDDREQLLASYEEPGVVPYLGVHHSDGISTASSVGTESPDIFQRTESKASSHNDVEVNCDTILTGFAPLHVRRGSEPALNRISPIPNLSSNPMKRWSAAILGDDDVGPDVSTPKDRSVERLCEEESMKHTLKVSTHSEPSAFQRFSSESGRVSILGNNAETYRWVEAADRQLFRFQSQESLGTTKQSTEKLNGENSSKITNVVILRNEGGPLGIHVVPDYDETGKDVGLVVQGIEPGGRIDRDGRLQVQDRIIEINEQSLLDVNFQRAQEIFKDALQTSEIKLHVIKNESDGKLGCDTGTLTKISTASASARPTSTMLVANTRKIGKKIHIQLSKGPEGLGFSVTTRDNPAGGNCPIYIKNILPKGAAILDGRLKSGDRLLEVNGVEMTGKSQTEAVTILRNTPLGGTVNLVVSRQEAESPRLPRELIDDSQTVLDGAQKAPEENRVYPWKHRDTLTFVIPLNDTESAGLGVSVKGKTSTGPKGTYDLGIFVKSVIKGGAASKDGRLLENDQLVSVNDVVLLGKTNSQAMETLRRAIQQEGPNPNAITLVVARRGLGQSNASHVTYISVNQDGSTGSVSSDNNSSTVETNSAVSEHSDGTTMVIMHPWSVWKDADENKNLDLREGNPRKIEDKDLGLDVSLRNPVVDRLMGQRTTSQAMRNESYYRATHDLSWNKTPPPNPTVTVTSHENKVLPLQRIGSMACPTVNMTHDNSIVIEDEYSSPAEKIKGKSSPVPEDKLSLQHKTANEQEPPSLDSNATYMSQLSLDDPTKNFSRDGFGRQSMSEKRHAHLDAKNTDTYQRTKKAREEREKQRHSEQQTLRGTHSEFRANSADSLLNVHHGSSSKVPTIGLGPVLGMKRSSSLESLQTRMAEAAAAAAAVAASTNPKDEDGENFTRPAVKAVRGRGCNESFRAAVDRSYDAPQGNVAEGMDTLEEESESGSSGLGRGNSWQLRIPGEFAPDDVYHYGKKHEKKKGLLSGLGSIFKFGTKRKTSNDEMPRLTMEDLERQKLEAEKLHAHKAAQEEQERIQRHYRKLLQHQSDQEKTNGPGDSREQRIHQLRSQHQRKHVERQGQYAGEVSDREKEDHHRSTYGHIDRQNHKPRYLKEPTRYSFQVLSSHAPVHQRSNSLIHSQRYDSEVVHARSHSYDVFKEIERPGSRKGIVGPNKYSHYVNYEEIQQHLNQQKKPFYLNRPDSHRLASTYFEYESIKSGVKVTSVTDANNSLPRKSSKVPFQPSTAGGSERPDFHVHASSTAFGERRIAGQNFKYSTEYRGHQTIPTGYYVKGPKQQTARHQRDSSSNTGSKV